MFISPEDSEFWYFISTLENEQSWHSALYTQSALEYYKEGIATLKRRFIDQSFILLWEEKPVFAFIGACIQEDSGCKLLAYQIPSISLESAYMTRKARKVASQKAMLLFQSRSQSIQYRDFLLNGNLSIISNLLLSLGALSKPSFSSVINLLRSENEIKSNIRKSYHSLINWGLREIQPQVVESESLTWNQMLEFRRLHIREAGRETRSEDTWRCQLSMVRKREAFVVFGHLQGELVSAGFFFVSSKHCFYASSASRRDLFDRPLFHALMWTAILYSKKIGCEWFETGDKLYTNHTQDLMPTSKEKNISQFKAGFGVDTRMFLDLLINV